MPKRIFITKHDGRTVRTKLPAKHRIGNRKSGKSAETMSNEDLLDRLTTNLTTNLNKKDHSNCETVLIKRLGPKWV